jgi:hypothetical protein
VTAVSAQPRSLRQAHDMVMGLRPGPNASSAAWLSFYRRSSAVYREVAEIDHEHRGHALYWAEREHANAQRLAARSTESSRSRNGKTAVGPTTLEQVHSALAAMRPAAEASVRHWLAYHRRAAAMYSDVADVDRAHHHEALAWAAAEREKAAELGRQTGEGR